MSRILCAAVLVLAAPLMTACGCSAPDSWVSGFSGRLGHTTAPAGMAESDSGAVFVTLVERGDGDAYDGAASLRDTAGIRLVRRQREAGRCA